MNPNIELNIDQLVLEGFTRNEAFTISQSLQTELYQLIENSSLQSTLTQSYHQRKMNVNAISASLNTRPEGIGREIAHSIFNGLSATDTVNNK